MLKLLTTGIGAAIGLQLVIMSPAQADHRRHWFYDHYQSYDGQAFDYRRRPRIYQRRNFEFELGYRDPDQRYEPYDDDDYVSSRRDRRTYPWRDRTIRYDLSRKNVNQRRAVTAPLPREKPHGNFTSGSPANEDQVEYSALGDPSPTKPDAAVRKISKPAAAPVGAVSCEEARGIVAGFGFSHIEAKSCTGSTYSFAAQRNGKRFAISLSSQNGELTEVKRQ